jgi:hypothetical protein
LWLVIELVVRGAVAARWGMDCEAGAHARQQRLAEPAAWLGDPRWTHRHSQRRSRRVPLGELPALGQLPAFDEQPHDAIDGEGRFPGVLEQRGIPRAGGAERPTLASSHSAQTQLWDRPRPGICGSAVDRSAWSVDRVRGFRGR